MGKVIMSGIVPQLEEPVAVNPVFENNTWDAIIKAVQKNKVPETWVVGDSKTMTINGADYTIDIIGKNHDTYSDGSGKAPLTLQMHDCYGTSYPYHKYYNNTLYSGVWDGCELRNIYLPEILALMPSEVQNGIREVNKASSKYISNPPSINTVTTADKLFLLSEVEVSGLQTHSFKNEGAQYEYYKAGNSAIKTVNGAGSAWWLRSIYNDGPYFCMCTTKGDCSYTHSYNERGVSFAFCF